jgi:2-keto-4-pentenoate hydratase
MTDDRIADMLLTARRSRVPVRIEVADTAQAYAVQRLVMEALGDIGGWKVGADGPDAPPSCAPMPASHLVQAPGRFSAAAFTQREVESEICFTFGESLPPRDASYAAHDIMAAIATCQPGIEVLQSRLVDPDTAGRLAILADLNQHGAFAWGAPISGWRGLDFAGLKIRQTIEGAPTREAIGNPAGDMLRLMLWLANQGAVWAGGIKAGQIVTCGSWTGKTRVPVGSQATASFDFAQPVHVSFPPG